MTRRTPRAAATERPVRNELPVGPPDTVRGYGVMGVPFESGDYLALRDWPCSSFGPGYRAVWHRDPEGHWTIYANVPPDLSCARFFSAALDGARTAEIEVDWPDDHALQVRVVGHGIEWSVVLGAGTVTRALTATSSAMPAWTWHSNAALRVVGASAAFLLRTGRMRLAGTVPNGHAYQLNPHQMWNVRRSSASVHGRAVGEPHPIAPQPRLGEVTLPQRGVFYAATVARFDQPVGQQT